MQKMWKLILWQCQILFFDIVKSMLNKAIENYK